MSNPSTRTRLAQLKGHLETTGPPENPETTSLGSRVRELVSQGRDDEATELALREFLSPPRREPKSQQQGVLDAAEKRVIKVGDHKVHTFIWSPKQQQQSIAGYKPVETVIVAHGFAQSTADMTPLIAHLHARTSFRIVAADHVGHGSSPGSHCSTSDFALILRHMIEDPQNQPLAAVIGHSQSAVSILLLIDQVHEILQRTIVVGINTPLQAVSLMVPFCKAHGIPAKFIDLMNQRLRPNPHDVLKNQALSKARGIKTLIFQDDKDQVSRMVETEQLVSELEKAGAVVHFEKTHNLGHFKPIADKGVLDSIVNHIEEWKE